MLVQAVAFRSLATGGGGRDRRFGGGRRFGVGRRFGGGRRFDAMRRLSGGNPASSALCLPDTSTAASPADPFKVTG